MSDFVAAFNAMAADVHANAQAHGWWETERNDGEMIALMHSELSEALEALRAGYEMDEHCPKHFAIEVELADCIIRIMDYAEARELNIGAAIIAKHNFNRAREYKHGKTF